jgi:hypothetical protein
LKFSRNLLAHNWRAVVLTAKTRAYEKFVPLQRLQIPPQELSALWRSRSPIDDVFDPLH